MEHSCPYCSKPIEHDGRDQYVQCPFCGEVNEYYNRKLRTTDENG